MDVRQVVIEPVISEKSYALMSEGKYTFRVADRAHKTQVAHAIEEIFVIKLGAETWPEGVIVAPVRVQNHTAAVLYGDAATAQQLADAREVVGVIAGLVGEALMRLIIAKKQGDKP